VNSGDPSAMESLLSTLFISSLPQLAEHVPDPYRHGTRVLGVGSRAKGQVGSGHRIHRITKLDSQLAAAGRVEN
jgi:hypothetical protein